MSARNWQRYFVREQIEGLANPINHALTTELRDAATRYVKGGPPTITEPFGDHETAIGIINRAIKSAH